MNELRSLIVTEAKLLFREPIYWLVVILLPAAVLVIFGSMFGPSQPDPALGGLRFIDVFVPSLVVISVATLGIQTLPIRLATYREKGVLRRLSTTPAHPMRLLIAQFVVYSRHRGRRPRAAGRCRERGFGVPWPREPLAYIAAFVARDELPVRDRAAAGGRRAVVRGGHGDGHPGVLRGDAAWRRLPPARLPAGHPRSRSATSRRRACRDCRTRGWARRRSCCRSSCWPAITSSAGSSPAVSSVGNDGPME